MDEGSKEVISRGTPANRWDIGTTMRWGGSLKANANVNSFWAQNSAAKPAAEAPLVPPPPQAEGALVERCDH